MIPSPRCLLIASLLMTSAACGDDDVVGAGGAGGGGGGSPTSTQTSTSTGDQGGGGASSCEEPEPPGATFTLRFQNDRDRDLFVPNGCGTVPQVRVELPDGSELRIDPESGEDCGFVCERFFEDGSTPTGCSDCGPETGVLIPAGSVVEHAWDRRVFREGTVTTACSGLDEDFVCAFGDELEEGIYAATVIACEGEGCSDGEVQSTAELDLSGDVAVFVFAP